LYFFINFLHNFYGFSIFKYLYVKSFRARGPSIHRKMDLSQVQRGPIGNREDPLADPFDDPSYSFNYKYTDQQRREDADSSGRVRGSIYV